MPHSDHVNGTSDAGFELPPDLENSVLNQFDGLVAKGEIIWAPYFSEPVEEDGFKAVFEVGQHLEKKPIQSDDAPERKTGKGKNPFVDPDPNFVVTYVGRYHTLLQNKYCLYRPSLILHTNDFEPQSDDLDANDLTAAWTVLKHFKAPSLVIYNCGFDSGSSQGHKHMQIWPYPDQEQIGFDLFPGRAKSTTEITSDIANVPHQHFVLRFTPDTKAADVIQAFSRLLTKIKECHKLFGSTGYNVAMTKDWLCLIARRDSGISRGAGSNAAGVLGLIWISYDSEKDIWLKPSLCGYIQFLGVPRNATSANEHTAKTR